MNIDWNAFTPWASLGGGLLIGLASALYLLGNGRVAGIAGIVASPLRAVLGGGSLAPERARLLFILGLLVAPWVSVSAASTARSKWRGPCASVGTPDGASPVRTDRADSAARSPGGAWSSASSSASVLRASRTICSVRSV